MKVILYGRTITDEYADKIDHLFSILSNNNIEIVVYESYWESIKRFLSSKTDIHFFKSLDDFPEDGDILISLGGDGTLLETIPYVRKSNIPIIGFNFGRLGFLANVADNEIEEALKDIIKKKYAVENRTLIKLSTDPEIFKDFPYALNEVTIQKKDSSLISIQTYINDQFLNSYWADGLIISTPTGSTAYSLSVGGPIVSPDSQNIIISPIAPHNLTVRPIIIPNQSKLTFSLEGRSDEVIISLDSKIATCSISTRLEIHIAEFTVKFLKLANHDFFNTIRNKLMWGVDKRN